MDKEQTIAKHSRFCNGFSLLVTALLVICILFSAIAMTISVLSFYQSRSLQGNIIIVEDDPAWEEETLSKLERQFEGEGVMSFSRHHHSGTHTQVTMETAHVKRDEDIDRQALLDDMCNSTKDSNSSDSLPLAHIVPYYEDGRPIDPIGEGFHRESYVVVTKNWQCGAHTRNNPFGIISGGMAFNRSSGFLVLPKDGVYFIYSHVQFRLLETTDETYETVARMAACVPDGVCEMTSPSRFPKLTESGSSITRHSHSHRIDGANGLYQGGLFHFPAGTRIAILAKDTKYNQSRRVRDRPGLFTSLSREDSYFGAYLVQEKKYK